MKTPKILCAFAALAFSLTASAQTATTDPVGFTTITANANSDCPIGLPLNRAPVLQTTISGISGNVLTVNATLVASAYVYTSPTQTNYFYVSIKSTVNSASSVNGKWFQVLSNTSTTITVDPSNPATVQVQGLAVGDTIEIIPFWTLNTLFPNGQSLTATSNLNILQDLISELPQDIAGVNLSTKPSSCYCTDLTEVAAPGWYNANTLEATGDNPIVPDSYLILKNKGASQPTTITGTVPMSNKTSSIVRLVSGRQDNFIVNPFPIAISLPETNLFESGAFEVTTNVNSVKDILYVWNGSETGFNISASKTYIYTNDLSEVPSAGWYDANTLAGPFLLVDKLVPAGGSMIVRKANGPAVEISWKAPKPY
ncbi:MAG: TIGR02597 family protein [Verrucomicrobia bacterium]|nr:TIGR02597 family protein [Verrucomicrobiota bacterium]